MPGWDTRLGAHACDSFPLITALTHVALKSPRVTTSEAVTPTNYMPLLHLDADTISNYIHLPMLSGWQAFQQKCPVFL